MTTHPKLHISAALPYPRPLSRVMTSGAMKAEEKQSKANVIMCNYINNHVFTRHLVKYIFYRFYSLTSYYYVFCGFFFIPLKVCRRHTVLFT